MAPVVHLVERTRAKRKAAAQWKRERIIETVRDGFRSFGDRIDGAALVIWGDDLRAATCIISGERCGEVQAPMLAYTHLVKHAALAQTVEFMGARADDDYPPDDDPGEAS